MKIVFILGAGASRDLGYPLGTELKNNILENIKSGRQLDIELRAAGNSPEDVASFGRKLFCADFQTIDEFIQAKPRGSQMRTIGKQAIALTIARCENEDNLFGKAPGSHWYRIFSDYLKKRHPLISEEHFSFFTFNYDRSLEHYLHESLTSSFEELQDSVRSNFLNGLNFVHIHGKVGDLMWETKSASNTVRAYGTMMSSDQTRLFAQNIILPDENPTLVDRLTDKLRKADVVLFIGFGFHEANCKRILLEEIGRDPKKKVFVSVQALDIAKRAMLEALPSVRALELDATNFVQFFLNKLEAKTLDDWGENESQKHLRQSIAGLEKIVTGVSQSHKRP